MIAIRVPSTGNSTICKLFTPVGQYRYPAVYLAVYFQKTASSFGTMLYHKLPDFYTIHPPFYNDFKRCGWAIRSAADGSSVNSSSPGDDSSNGTRLIRAIKVIRDKLNLKIKDFKKNFAVKLLFFLVGFYSATAFATVIGQTGDWDILSAALAVAIVEGIGALMYKSSLPLFGQLRSLITMFNYWKAGLSLGLFLDSFKY